jgi:trans-aconitate methyltransferase
VALTAEGRQQAKTQAQALIDSASSDLEHGTINEIAWSRRVADALASAYLLDDDPRWQSGFDGDHQLWREARELILAPVHREGTLLDIGCANGYLMDSLQAWAAERGLHLLVYGLELSPALVSAARRRLPEESTRIFEGNVLDWIPNRRFGFVHTGLEYAPVARHPWLVRRLLDLFVESKGRLIAGPIDEADLATTVEVFRDAGASPSTSWQTDRNGKTRYVVWCERERS